MIEYIRIKGKNVGFIDYEKKIYFSSRDPKLHFFRIYNGYGMSMKILNYLDEKNIFMIILDLGIRKLETDTENFWMHGKEFKDNTMMKEDVQLILPLEYFNREVKHEEIQKML